MKCLPSVLTALVFGVSAASDLSAEEWSRFRGPNGSGVSEAKGFSVPWTAEDIAWKVELPGLGHSSPVLWGDRIFLTSAGDKAGEFHVMAWHRDGQRLWQRTVPLAAFTKHKFNSYASATPAADARHLYVAWGDPTKYVVAAFDHDGNLVWQRDLGPYAGEHGCGTSLMVHENRLIVGGEQDAESFIAALDVATGETVWKTPRRSARVAYSTPCVYQPKGAAPALIFNSQAHGIYAVDPSNGKVLWEYAQAFDKRSVSSPVVSDDLIFGSCGSGGGGNYVIAIRAGDSTTGRAPSLAYQMKKSAPYVPTSVIRADLGWLWSDAGILTCVHVPTGDVRYQERVGGNFFGSPVWVDGRLYAVSTAGEIVVVAAADQFKVLFRYPLNETCHATPAVGHGRIYFRTEQRLHALNPRPTSSAR